MKIKLLEDKRNILKKGLGVLERHLPIINVLLILALVIVTVNLISVTGELISVTEKSSEVAKNLGNIEMYLAYEREKQETIKQINLGESLIIEMIWNRAGLDKSIQNLEEARESSESISDDFKIEIGKQAKETVNFGSPDIKLKLGVYVTVIKNIKEDFSEIQNSVRGGDSKVKNERIGSAIKDSKMLIEEFKLDEFMTEINDYVDSRRDYYNEINVKSRKFLLSLPDMENQTLS